MISSTTSSLGHQRSDLKVNAVFIKLLKSDKITLFQWSLQNKNLRSWAALADVLLSTD